MKNAVHCICIVFLWSLVLSCSPERQSDADAESSLQSMDCPLEARLTDDDRTVLQQNVEDLVRFALAGDWEAYASLHTDDVTMMPANDDLFTGRETLVEAYAGLTLSEFSAKLDYVDGCGDIAYGRGQASYTLSVADNPESVSESLKWVVIWRKQGDGRWLIELDIDNANAAPGM